MTQTLAAEVIRTARAKGLRIATAESCTGGMIGAALTGIAGSSAVFDRGFITYSNGAKVQMLGVAWDTLGATGAVSEPVAREMAGGALERADAAIAIAVTGIAGPGASEHKPEGRVCFGIATKAEVRSETVEFGAIGRENVRAATVDHALRMVMDQLDK